MADVKHKYTSNFTTLANKDNEAFTSAKISMNKCLQIKCMYYRYRVLKKTYYECILMYGNNLVFILSIFYCIKK